MKLFSYLKIGVLAFLVTLSVVYVAQSTSWWEKFFPKEKPQVLSGQAATPRVTPPPEVVNLQDSFAQVAEAVKPAVVNISAVHINQVQAADPYEFFFGDPNEFFRRFFGQPGQEPPMREFRTEGTGSGVIIDPDGFILTNNHVVQGAEQLTVTLASGKSFRGKVVGTDPRTDVAVIKIKSSNPFEYAPLGDSTQIRIGDWVLAIGSPFGLEQTVTAGIISAIRQSLNIEGRLFRDLIQTDAAINRGNSGGPLVNLRGEVVGINTAIYAPTGVFSGVGFAIPVSRAKAILRELIEKGYVERSWMGIEIVTIDEVIAKQFGLDSKEGALINNVLPDSPAAKAGLKRGDVVLEFDGKKIKNVGELQDIVAATPPNKTVRVKVMRGGSEKTLKLTTAVMPSQVAMGERPGPGKDQDGPKETSWLGAKFMDLSERLRRAYSIADDVQKGIVVVGVPPDSLAADAGLMEGDVIRTVNQKKVHRVRDLEEIKEDLSVKEGLVFDVLRRGRWIYLSYKSLQ